MLNEIVASIDFPTADVKIYRPEISVMGYAFTEENDDLDIQIFIDQQQVETARWGLPRMDVYRKYSMEPAYLSGFVVRCPIPGFPRWRKRKRHEFTVSVKSGNDKNKKFLDPIRFYSGREDGNDKLVPRLVFPAGAPGLYKKFGKDQLNSMISEGGLQASDCVLEIGCGMGRTAANLANYITMDSNYFGIDVLAEAVNYNNSHISTRYRNFHFHRLDIKNEMYNPHGDMYKGDFSIPLQDESIDFTYCWSLFTHLKPHDVKRYLAEISRVLKPGGVLYASYFVINEDRRKDNNKIGSFSFDIKGEQYWTKDKKMAEQAIAYDLEDLLQWYKENKLSVNDNAIYLTGSLQSPISCQDIIVARKN